MIKNLIKLVLFILSVVIIIDYFQENYSEEIKKLAKKKIQTKKIGEKFLTPRQNAILNKIMPGKEYSVNEILSLLEQQITERTLRRDLESLELYKFVKQVGKTKNSKYIFSYVH